jgi:hypothetical protein
MRTTRVFAEKNAGTAHSTGELGHVAQQGMQDVVENVLGARRRSLRGQLDAHSELRGACDGALENNGEHARPDEPLRDLRAFLNTRDPHHQWAQKTFSSFRLPLVTCDAVLSEACNRDQSGGGRRKGTSARRRPDTGHQETRHARRSAHALGRHCLLRLHNERRPFVSAEQRAQLIASSPRVQQHASRFCPLYGQT